MKAGRKNDRLRCPFCGIPTIQDATGMTENDAICNACADAIEEDADREMGLERGYNYGHK